MARAQVERVEAFVREAFGAGDGELVLYVLGSDHSRTPCARWAVTPDVDDASREAYEAIEERALRQANTLGGVHAFVLEWLRGGEENGSPRVHSHEAFRVSAESVPGAHVMTEPANEGGLIAQAMRHQEATTKQLLAATNSAMSHMTRVLDRVSTRAEKIEEKYSEQMTAFLEARWAQSEHEVQLVKAQGSADAKRALAGRVATLLPAIAGRAVDHFGKSGMPVRLRGFVESLTHKQVMEMAATLQPEQQALLFEVVLPVLKELEAEKAEAGEAEPSAPQKDGVRH